MTASDSSHPPPLRLASVSYLNAKPLIYGLDTDTTISIELDVPSRLIDGLRDGKVNVSLLPVIDYQRLPNLVVVPAGGIGCDGPTLTVRIFSRVPIDQIQTLACDRDSHTSVALARILLAERYERRPAFVDFEPGVGDSIPQHVDAMLLIGDKVVINEPSRAEFPFQVDLGEGWKNLTGLPFVFAVWTARDGVELGNLPGRLIAAREMGLKQVEQIIHDHAVPRGWPVDLARQYLTQYLQFAIGERQLRAIETFHARCASHGLIPSPARPLRFCPDR